MLISILLTSLFLRGDKARNWSTQSLSCFLSSQGAWEWAELHVFFQNLQACCSPRLLFKVQCNVTWACMCVKENCFKWWSRLPLLNYHLQMESFIRGKSSLRCVLLRASKPLFWVNVDEVGACLCYRASELLLLLIQQKESFIPFQKTLIFNLKMCLADS